MSENAPWTTTKVADLGRRDDVVQTGPFGAQLHAKDYTKEGIPLILIRNIKESGLDESNIPKISNEDAERLSRYSLIPGDIVFSRVGRVGSCFLAEDKHKGWIISGQTLRTRTDPRKVYPGFLFYALQQESVREYISGASVGTTRTSINTSILEDIEIPLPPLPEQKKIAEILSGIDAIIQKQKRKAITLGHLQASLIKDITLGTKEEGSRQATDIGECPADWRATKLGDIADFANGNSFKSEDWQENGYPIIRIQNLNGGSDFNYFSGRIDEKWFVPRGQLLFAWSGQRGKSFGPFIWNGQDGVLNQHIFKVTYAQDIDRDFLFLLLKMVQLNAERDAHGFKDSFMHVKKSDIVTTSIAIPPVEAQKRLANSYKQVSLQISLEEKKMESLKNLKYSISADLLSGRKRVSI